MSCFPSDVVITRPIRRGLMHYTKLMNNWVIILYFSRLQNPKQIFLKTLQTEIINNYFQIGFTHSLGSKYELQDNFCRLNTIDDTARSPGSTKHFWNKWKIY